MARGAIDALLDTVLNLTEMDRQQRKDKEAAAQQAVDNALRQHQQELEAQAQAQRATYEQQTFDLAKSAEERRVKEGQQRSQYQQGMLQARLTGMDQARRTQVERSRDAIFKSLVPMYTPEVARQIADQYALESTYNEPGGAGQGAMPSVPGAAPAQGAPVPALGPVTLFPGGAPQIGAAPLAPATQGSQATPLELNPVAKALVDQRLAGAARATEQIAHLKRIDEMKEEAARKADEHWNKTLDLKKMIANNTHEYQMVRGAVDKRNADSNALRAQASMLLANTAQLREFHQNNRAQLQPFVAQYLRDEGTAGTAVTKVKDRLDTVTTNINAAKARLQAYGLDPEGEIPPGTLEALEKKLNNPKAFQGVMDDVGRVLNGDRTIQQLKGSLEGWRQVRAEAMRNAKLLGAGETDKRGKVLPPSTRGKVLDAITARALLQEAGGNKAKARALAKQRGYQF